MSASSPSPAGVVSTPPRFAAVDALRGVGAVAIAAYHIHRYGPLPPAADEVLTVGIQELICHGWLAVPMFLVIAGFVGAYSLRNERLNVAAVANFAARRGCRLGAPYWTVLFLVLAMSYPVIYWLQDLSLTEPISWQQLLASVFFLQDILGYDSISRGMWFVCIDMQFGLALVLLLWLTQCLPFGRRKGSRADGLVLSALFLPLAMSSLFWFGVLERYEMWVHYFFHILCYGMLAWWAIEGRLPGWLFWAYTAVLMAAVGQRWFAAWGVELSNRSVWDDVAGFPLPYEVEKITMTILTGVTLYGLGRTGHLGDWFQARGLQYLGRVSYSLFLIHYPVSWTVTAVGYRLTGERPAAAVLWLAVAFLASVGAADMLYRLVEAPSLRLVRKIRRLPAVVAER